jgi:hypothetical protein
MENQKAGHQHTEGEPVPILESFGYDRGQYPDEPTRLADEAWGPDKKKEQPVSFRKLPHWSERVVTESEEVMPEYKKF